MTMQGVTPLQLSRTSCAADSVLTRYESMRFRFLRQSEKNHCEGSGANTRDEFIRAIGRSIRNINKGVRIDGVQRLQKFGVHRCGPGGRFI